ncbi:MAG TPA: tail fiber domain-containing protein [Parafilimonas sp.]|nr:tail fiber domain-containing protein [Parafilimonas sp.]
MKKIYTSIGICLMPFFVQQLHAQANTQLSNLNAPTKINASLIPNQNNARSLGNSNKGWKDIYMGGILRRGGYTWLGGGVFTGNTFLGERAGNYLIANGDGGNPSNTFIGSSAGFNTTTGGANTFVGTSAGFYNTSGDQNTFLGWDAGTDNTTGGSNTFLGVWAGNRNTTGSYNVMIGKVAGAFNKTGRSNVYIGNLSGYEGGNGSYNTFAGDSSGMKNTSSHNTMMGRMSGASNTSGTGNTFLGSMSAHNNTTGGYNTAIGHYALDDNDGASGNTALGYSTGTVYANGSYNTFVGYNADASAASLTNSSALGSQSTITASNQVRIGNSSVTSIGGYVGWTDLPSDVRFKKNIKENVPGLQFINQLRPVTYNMDVIKLNQFLNAGNRDETSSHEKISGADEALIKMGIEEKEKVVRTGFIAQEVEIAAKKLGYDFSGVDKPQNEHSLYGLRYAEFVVPLVKAVQELSRMNDEKDAVILQQQKQIDVIMVRLEALEKKNGITGASNAKGEGLAFMAQNTPNPFKSTTVINYSVPEMISSAKLNITDVQGRTVKTISLKNRQGNVSLNSGELSAGNYFYELIVDGKKFGSRQMTVIK